MSGVQNISGEKYAALAVSHIKPNQVNICRHQMHMDRPMIEKYITCCLHQELVSEKISNDKNLLGLCNFYF